MFNITITVGICGNTKRYSLYTLELVLGLTQLSGAMPTIVTKLVSSELTKVDKSGEVDKSG